MHYSIYGDAIQTSLAVRPNSLSDLCSGDDPGSHRPGCQYTRSITATTTGANSKQPKYTSCVDRLAIKPSAVSAKRKHVLRYTANVATTSAAIKLLLIEAGLFLAFVKVQNSTTKKTANENTWKARPASRMLFGVVGSSWLE